ncbi:MAG: tRNA (adenosine(37)-N6)-threonylcarbamoyltransferase complex transferase subunit TsaD [Bacilli bacterium]|jgi:N6-L-threonylcarbamoyladenine synthase
MKDEVILSVESSCDETAIAVLKNGTDLLVNTVNTQIKDHQRFGGVYPELASRLHLQNITKVVSYALSLKGFDYHTITYVAVTGGPGLPGALQIGNMAAKTIAQYLDVPIISCHHLAGHIYANEYAAPFHYPLLALIASGGNTQLVLLRRPLDFKVIGETEDDAIGEAFDKVARELGLPYPGGVMIDKISREPGIETFPLPRPKVGKYNFSYSGLKSHLVRMIEKEPKDENGKLPDAVVKKYARSTEVAFVDQLLDKTLQAAIDYNVKQVVVGGGVSANSYLREAVQKKFASYPKIAVVIPPLWCTTDNAAMIAMVGHHMLQLGITSPMSYTTEPNRDLEKEGPNSDMMKKMEEQALQEKVNKHLISLI